MNLPKLPAQERPRERLVNLGPDALSLTELLAILLTTGTKDKSVLELAQEIVVRFGSLQPYWKPPLRTDGSQRDWPGKSDPTESGVWDCLKTHQKPFIAQDAIHAKASL